MFEWHCDATDPQGPAVRVTFQYREDVVTDPHMPQFFNRSFTPDIVAKQLGSLPRSLSSSRD
jgi:hypothetical protein